ncbi:hypothetical protein C8R46DRAFT_1116385 [Mycena filopes]|nr:hypothetical protein C8R46DRAFT_1116385 [Mycena filopes]
MSSPSTAAASTSSTLDLQSLVNRIEVFFTRLRDENKDHSRSFTAAFERLTTAVETLNTQAQFTDQKTAFWTTYGKLATEFDEEFLQKYGNDLDTSLIFAGLFSAVSSAFIIQIQPEFQADPNATTETLLLLLVQNITGTMPAVQISTQPTPVVTLVVAQSLLYFSLSSTLLAALLAVLGKQWLLHYSSVGARGTIEERGVERQRKLDGLRRWKFDLVMQLSPLLLQLALLLFASALSVYLWSIHHALAAIVLGLTSFGALFYALMVLSALAVPDSPFQTPFTALLRGGLTKFRPGVVAILLRIVQSCSAITKPIRRWLLRVSVHPYFLLLVPSVLIILPNYIRSYLQKPMTGKIPTLVASFWESIASKLHPQRLHPSLTLPALSPEAAAVVWALEISTDPRVVEVAAAVVPELQWPVNLDLRACLRRLSDVFDSCFQDQHLRDGMSGRASYCIKAFGVLEMVTVGSEGWSRLWTFPHRDIFGAPSELQSIVHYFRSPSAASQPITQWTLRFMVKQELSDTRLDILLQNFHPEDHIKDITVFTDFMYTLAAFFSKPHPQTLSVLDKSKYAFSLLSSVACHISESLRPGRLARMYRTPPRAIERANTIVSKIAAFQMDLPPFRRYGSPAALMRGHFTLRRAVYEICGCPGITHATATTLLRFATLTMDALLASRVDTLVTVHIDPRLKDVAWAYRLLEQLDAKDIDTTADLVQVLFHHIYLPRSKPPSSVVRIILSVLESNQFDETARYFAFRLMVSFVDQWVRDNPRRGPELRETSIWHALGAFSIPSLHDDITIHYISLGDKLAQLPHWRAMITGDAVGWLSHLQSVLTLRTLNIQPAKEFCTVLFLWVSLSAAGPVGTQAGNVLAVALAVLVKLWDQFVYTEMEDFVALLECSIFTAFTPLVAPDIALSAGIDVFYPLRRLQIDLPKRAASIVGAPAAATDVMRKLGLAIRNVFSLPEAGSEPTKTSKYWVGVRDEFLRNLRQSVGTDERRRVRRTAYITKVDRSM